MFAPGNCFCLLWRSAHSMYSVMDIFLIISGIEILVCPTYLPRVVSRTTGVKAGKTAMTARPERWQEGDSGK